MKSIELFAGAGGLALGVEAAGFQHLAVFEKDRNACQTLRRNSSAHNWEVVEGDVTSIDFRSYEGQIALVTGGPPCQPFSQGGKHRGHTDHRNMFPEAVRVVREVRPKAFLFENVKGLLRKNFVNYYSYIIHQFRYPSVRVKKGEDWHDHLARLEDIHTKGAYRGLHYNVVYRMMNAVEYSAGLGIPQRRERVFIVGVRADIGCEFHFPSEETHSIDALWHDMWISGDYWERHGISRKNRPPVPRKLDKHLQRLALFNITDLGVACRTVRDAISDLPKIGIGMTSHVVPNHFFNPGARCYPGHTGSPYDEPAKTLKAGDHGVPGGENTVRFDDGSVRYFSVRECARLQTFPDNWIVEGSWTEAMRQLGNAVPVKLAQLIAERLMKSLRAI